MTGVPPHSLLRRQLKQHFPDGVVPSGAWAAFVAAVDGAYRAFDDDRAMLERSLDLSSQELLQANSEMRALFQAIPDLLFRVDGRGVILSAKIGAGDDPLLPPAPAGATLPGQRIQETVVQAANSRFDDALVRTLTEKRPQQIEFECHRGQKHLVYEARLVPVLEREALVILRNITGPKRVEEELRRTISLQQSTIESTADGILVVNLVGQVVSFNRRLVAMWLIPEEMLRVRTDGVLLDYLLQQVIDPDSFLRRVQELYASPASESHDTIEFRDGRSFERYSCPQLQDGVPIGRVWSFRDVTERKRAEAAFRAEEERFRLVALATRDAIYDWNLVTGAIWRNDAFRAIFAAGGPVGPDNLWWEEHVHPDDGHRIKQSLADALVARERLWSQEYRFRRGDGSYATLIDRGYILYDAQGQPLRMIGAMTDISERKRLEEQFLQSQKMEAIGQLAGGVAHDFNNLLTVISGNLSLLRMNLLNDKERRQAVEDCSRAAERAANLTRQLLTFSRREPVELKALDLNDVVAEMTRMFHRLVGEHIQIATTFAPGGMPVLADAGMIEQLLMNLVVNSRDAMPRGGRLHIQTVDTVLDDTTVRTHPQGRQGRFVHLLVKDTGTGIAAEHLAHIFEPFFTTKEAGKGTGLGLATVFGIVAQHSGWIEVQSAVGFGTTFHVFLPRLLTSKPVDRTATPEERRQISGTETILIAEDEEAVRRWMQDLLRRHGYTVHAFPSGAEALRFHRDTRTKIDLLVTDMVMPGGLNGLDLAKEMSATQPGLKVLYCSGYAEEFLGPDAPRRDNTSFLAKPFGADKFLLRVRDRFDAG